MISLSAILKTRRSLIPSSWSVANPGLYSIINSGAKDGTNLAIVVGQDNVYSSTTDALSWNTYGSPHDEGVGNSINSIAYNGSNLWLMGGVTLARSVDGITWTDGANPFTSGSRILSIAYNASNLWIIATGTEIARSADGITWTIVPSPLGSVGRVIVEHDGSGMWVIAGDSGALYSSPDGITWTSRTSQFGASTIYDIKHDGIGVWVIVGVGGKISSSPDGITWTARTSNLGFSYIRSVYHNGAGLWIAASGNTPNGAASSPDGITWTSMDVGMTELFFVIYFDGYWIIFGSVDAGAVKSSDGITWSKYEPETGEQQAHCIAKDTSTGTIVAGYILGHIATSTNITDWVHGNNSFGTDTVYGLGSNNAGIFVACGSNGKLETSPDGITWTSRTTPVSTSLRDVANNGAGLWVVVGYSGVTMTSNDSITWTLITIPTPVAFLSVSYGGGLFVAGCLGGFLYTSPDGITWTSRVSGLTSNIVSSFYNAGMWIIVSEGKKIAYSYNGSTWTVVTVTTSTSVSLIDITYESGRWLIVGGYNDKSNLFASRDGKRWEEGVALPFKNAISAITYHDNKWVAASFYSAILIGE